MTLKLPRIQTALESMREKKIAVVGDFMLDRYVWGEVKRISPEAPVPVVEVLEDAQRPGGAGNVVHNLQSLGARCVAVGLIGEDPYAEELRSLMDANHVDISGLVATDDRPTTVKTRILSGDQQLLRVDREVLRTVPPELEELLCERVREALDGADALVLQDYNKGVLTSGLIRAAIEEAKKRGIVISVDPKRDNFWEYYGATLVKPNLREAEGALGRDLARPSDFERAGNELLMRLQCDYILITRGSEGMNLFAQNEQARHIATKARLISDVSGAGDTVIATMTLGLVAGLNGVEAATLANKAAGYVVGRVGVVPVTPEALLAEESR